MTLTTAEMRAAIVAQRQGPPKCERCGGPLVERKTANLRDGWRMQMRPCRRCALEDFAAEPLWAIEREEWRKREAEANAWHCEGDCGSACPYTLGESSNAVRAVNEADHRPRAIVEAGPEPGSDEAWQVMLGVMVQLAGTSFDEDPLSRIGFQADAEMDQRRTERLANVPAYTEVDRYDPQTGVPTKAKFLRGVLVRPGRLATAEEMLALLDEYGRKVGEAMAAQPSFLWSGPPIDEAAEEARVEQALGFTPGD
jgi:hypothetical protein